MLVMIASRIEPAIVKSTSTAKRKGKHFLRDTTRGLERREISAGGRENPRYRQCCTRFQSAKRVQAPLGRGFLRAAHIRSGNLQSIVVFSRRPVQLATIDSPAKRSLDGAP